MTREKVRSGDGRSRRRNRLIILGCVVALCGYGAYSSWRATEAAKKELAEANRLWDAGLKADAVARYKPLLTQNIGVPDDSEKPAVYQRIIDFELERGNTDEAKAYIEKAFEKKVAISSSNKATTQLIAQVRADREKREADERARREAEEHARREAMPKPPQPPQPVSWTGKLGTGKLGTGATAYDELPEPWKSQCSTDFRNELATYQAYATAAEKTVEKAKAGVTNAQAELTKFEARNKEELRMKDPISLSIHKDRKAAVAKAETFVKEAEAAVLAPKEKLAAFEKNDPPYFKKAFEGCRTFRDIENRLTEIDAQKRADEAKLTAEAERPRLSVDLVKVRIEPFRTADGLDTKMVYVDWKNTGNRPVRTVYATIIAVDKQGGMELYSAPNYTIYAVFNNESGIAPGEFYTEPKGKGHILPPVVLRHDARVTVEITRAKEQGIN